MTKKDAILIVDDDALMRWTLSEAVQGWGYEAIAAESASAALAALAPTHLHAYRLVAALLDINLPDGSGLDLLREIKHRHPETAVVMMTGEVNVENTIAALRGGANDFVGKPIHLDELKTALEQAQEQQAQRHHVSTVPRLLIVTDSHLRAEHLLVSLKVTNVDVTVATTPAELRRATAEKHDLVVVDVEAEELQGTLAALRASAPHREVPLLVEISRITQTPSLSGVLPHYRAMPCSPTELVTLTRRRIGDMASQNFG
ncbi:MAG TPA: response regulator [Blastocatellia bacterium]|nr:response regulator [Blastocatellia bacterium]